MPIGGVLLVSDRTRRSGNGKLQNYTEYWPSNLDHGRNATKPARWNGLPDGVKDILTLTKPTNNKVNHGRENAEGSLWVSCDQAQHIIVLKNVHGPSL
ncbi:hypothetical protein I7I51_08241 [Histoplasma capsulatum]|uniref:Uncharacterized protein n=1 Tax=Ajellomyces capsulatus TaxID=5037 RepID=A0A8A1M303_AJECA|nr:hypothetical protein I7I51_08241 [Histoplasma capsulatum]